MLPIRDQSKNGHHHTPENKAERRNNQVNCAVQGGCAGCVGLFVGVPLAILAGVIIWLMLQNLL
ncbi:MAG: hypothetical protein FJ319_02540 [SAR202 cluster bacterium]|nr:hypothetical protein [SAR202 cluster bacterium]